MAVLTAVASKTVPVGEYLCKVKEITEETGEFGKQFKWHFEILSPEEYAGDTLIGWTSTSPSLKGKFMQWAQQCFKSSDPNAEIEEGEPVDTDDLLNCKVLVTAIVEQSKKDNSEFNKVTGIKAHRKKARNGNKAAEEDAAEQQEEKKPTRDPFADDDE